jgi:hypothetical protein
MGKSCVIAALGMLQLAAFSKEGEFPKTKVFEIWLQSDKGRQSAQKPGMGASERGV